MTKLSPTLRQVFTFSLLGLFVGLALLFYLVLHGSEQTTLSSSDRYRELASRYVAHSVTSYLDEAPMAVAHFQQEVHFGLLDTRKIDSVEKGLVSLLLANDDISEATLTFAKSKGFDHDGNIVTDQATAGQVAVLRSASGEFISKRTWFDGKQFVSQSSSFKGLLSSRVQISAVPVQSMDPTAHLTFQTTASSANYDPSNPDPAIKEGLTIWTDLHWSQVDEALPEAQRRVEVSVQKVIEDAEGHFAGVLRVGLMKTQIDRAVQQHITGRGEKDPHLIFICDPQGRLITGFGPKDHVIVSGDDLRIPDSDAPEAVKRALQMPELAKINENRSWTTSSFSLGDKLYLCTFLYLPGTQDWIVGIVVPRDFYLGPLLNILRFVLVASLALIVAIIVSGGVVSRSILRAQSLIMRETARMKEFEFSPSDNRSSFRDIKEILVGLERAKTAMRAMSKYVPVNLVRRLYQKGEEPLLGGKSLELSVLFTDIKDFTAFSESMTSHDLAEVLGRYLQVMAETIQTEQGTIDKYIGDSVMAFWNAPEPVLNHEILACRAALRCRDALQRLYKMPDWGNAPRFETRFGLHRCIASVGHFGAPDRFNYTAIGDGINLSSRLEGLNKYYGTQIIVSESIYLEAKDSFIFRLLDRVAVKGKTEGTAIYELVAEQIANATLPAMMLRYEQAFAVYQRGDFEMVIGLLEQQIHDNPSRVLVERCREFLKKPILNWKGIQVFESK